LLADLESGDVTRRELAISALRRNGDPRLAPFVATMLGDPKWNIRLTGFRMGHAGVQRKDPAFTAVAPVLETLLRDPHWSVRREALITFAFAGNQASVPVLHELLTKWAAGDPFLSDADFHQLASLADAIGRQRFGFGDSRARVPARRDPKNPAAVEKFARWATAR
jgi:HEAT repeat protein